METLVLTKKDFDDSNNYIGSHDLASLNMNLEIEANLGWVKFIRINVLGFIFAKAGSGIEAGLGIKAGSGIKAGWGIEAGLGIKAGSGIEAGWGIEAGSGIEAGWGIKAGWGIEAGWGITCKTILSIRLRIFAGLCLWRLPAKEEQQITCGKLESGDVCYGELIETGVKNDGQVEGELEPVKTIVLDGVKYDLIESAEQ